MRGSRKTFTTKAVNFGSFVLRTENGCLRCLLIFSSSGRRRLEPFGRFQRVRCLLRFASEEKDFLFEHAVVLLLKKYKKLIDWLPLLVFI